MKTASPISLPNTKNYIMMKSFSVYMQILHDIRKSRSRISELRTNLIQSNAAALIGTIAVQVSAVISFASTSATPHASQWHNGNIRQ